MTLDDMALHQSQISPRNARTKSSMVHDENDDGDDDYDDDNNDDDDIEGTKNQARKHELRCRSGSRNRRQSLESQDQRHQSHDATTIQRKTEERLEREYTREQRRQQKLQSRLDRERFAQEAKEAALRRAAELVTSHRVPIELTRGAAAAKVRNPATFCVFLVHQRFLCVLTKCVISFHDITLTYLALTFFVSPSRDLDAAGNC
jgi:hypothetical protein